MDSFGINREATRVSRAVEEVVDAIANDKELTDLASEMVGLGYHTYCLGLEMQKDEDPWQRELGRRMYEIGVHWHKQGGDLQAIALTRIQSHAVD